MSIKKILIEKEAENAPLTRRILEALPHLPVSRVDRDFVFSQVTSPQESKSTLFLTRFKGELLRPCPGTKEYICCGYQILHIGSNCPLDCSYCILQAYFNQPFIHLFVNLEEIFEKLKNFVKARPGEIIRLGTGEFTDSLAMDHWTGFSTLLRQELFSYPNVLVELKTKTADIENLLSDAPSDKLLISWSLNAPMVARKEERGAASLPERLEAARICQEKGYRLGFHFDPVFCFPGWEGAYQQTVQLLFSNIPSEKIAWISLGCFRFLPALKSIIEQRHPEVRYIHQEFIPALDHKMRYPQPQRVEIYRGLLKWIREKGPGIPVYLCMENSSVWEKVFGFIPGIGNPTLKEILDQRVKELWGWSREGKSKGRPSPRAGGD